MTAPAYLTLAEVAVRCERELEWVEARVHLLPVLRRGGAVVVRREDVRVWVEAAAPRLERRAAGLTERVA